MIDQEQGPFFLRRDFAIFLNRLLSGFWSFMETNIRYTPGPYSPNHSLERSLSSSQDFSTFRTSCVTIHFANLGVKDKECSENGLVITGPGFDKMASIGRCFKSALYVFNSDKTKL